MFLNNPAFAEEENIFYFVGGSTTSAWQTWSKPAGINFVNILAIAAGGTGWAGNGGSGALGGAGGPGGSTTIAIYPAKYLSDALYIRPGFCTNNGVNADLNTYVCLEPDTTVAYRLAYATQQSGRNNNTTISQFVGGAPIVTVADCPLITQATYRFMNGPLGGGGATGAGTSVTYPSGALTCGGGGGGGSSAGAGGNITGAGLYPTISGGTGSATTGVAGGNGQTGPLFWKPFMLGGGSGAGGHSVNAAGSAGGRGGDATAYGCGGGGGGGARNGPAGVGGLGGPGLVIISCW